MIAVYFFYGLAYFAMGLAVSLETRRATALPSGRQMRWLGAFALVHSLAEWSKMLLLVYPEAAQHDLLMAAHALFLPVSAILLIRFGAGMISEAGPLPDRATFLPPALLIPAAFLGAYAIVVTVSDRAIQPAAEIWSRYLLYFPGCVLAAVGFLRQWRAVRRTILGAASGCLLGAGLAFALNAIVAGLVVPHGPYGLAPWVNYDTVLSLTGVPVQVWRALVAVIVAVCVVRALDVYEADRKRSVMRLQQERDLAQQDALSAQAEARGQAEEWTNGLVAISRGIADLDDIDAVLRLIVTEARRLMRSDVATLALCDEDGGRLDVKCYAAADGAVMVEGNLPVRSALIRSTVEGGKPCRYPDDLVAAAEAQGRAVDVWVCPVLKCELKAVLIVPLQLDGRVFGGMWVGRYGAPTFAHDDVLALQRLGDQAVIALEHASMATHLQSLAVVEERSRLAREMHDGLAQILGYLGVEMQTLEILARQGDQKAMLAELAEARGRIREAQTDVRENILSLRTTLTGDVGLVPALQRFAEEFELQTGITVSVEVELAGPPHISPLAEVQLMRIVQEAMTNVRKHSAARHVAVRLSADDSYLITEIADNGVGFGHQNGHACFGLRIMRERAEGVGGRADIASAAGCGTTITVRLPLVEPRLREVAHVSLESSGR